MRAAVYARLSAKPETDDNITQQRERGREVVARRGWELADEYVDDGRSAWREDADRPAFRRLLEDVRRGDVEVVVARNMDRLTRNYTDWGALNQHGVRFADWSGDTYDAFRCGIEVARANAESERISERARLAEERRVAAGKPPRGGRRHFGYHSGTCCADCGHHQVHEAEAAVVREMAARWLAGEPMRALARELNERGVPHTSGRPWNHGTLKRVLLSPRLAAIRTHRGEEVPGAWEPVIPRELHDRLRAADAGSGSRRAPERYLLTGLLVCGREGCGATLNGHMHRPRTRRYACLACRRNGIAAEPVEEHLWNEALGRVWHRDRRGEERIAERLAEVEGELRESRARLEELDDAYWSERAVPKATYTRQATRLRDRVRSLDEEAGRLRAEGAQESRYWASLLSLVDAYETAGAEERRIVLSRALRRVVVAPWTPSGPAVDLSRLRPEWLVEAP